MFKRFIFCFGLFLVSLSFAQDYEARFEAAWRLVNERYWNLEERGIDWEAVKLDYKDDALAAQDDTTFYSMLESMYTELGDNHSVFVPPQRVAEIRAQYGDLPCLGVFASASQARRAGNITWELFDRDGKATGYIEVPDLATDFVAANIRRAVQELEDWGATTLILDMRGNPGGRLVEMMQAAGIFTRGFLWRTVTRWALPLPYPAIGAPETDLPLIILIDSGVNSAAEGLAGALQQKGRATVIGETSAGNVEAVLPFCLRDGSQAWIATGVLAPIGGPTWEGVGVVPDVEASSEEALEVALEYIGEKED